MKTVIKYSHGADNDIYYDALAIRVAVFVNEQGMLLENERDKWDEMAHHIVIYFRAYPKTHYTLKNPLNNTVFPTIMIN